jgi:MbtH protein
MSWDAHYPSYKVVVNPQGQLSMVPADRPTPPGMREEGTRGTREECQEHIRRRQVEEERQREQGGG